MRERRSLDTLEQFLAARNPLDPESISLKCIADQQGAEAVIFGTKDGLQGDSVITVKPTCRQAMRASSAGERRAVARSSRVPQARKLMPGKPLGYPGLPESP